MATAKKSTILVVGKEGQHTLHSSSSVLKTTMFFGSSYRFSFEITLLKH